VPKAKKVSYKALVNQIVKVISLQQPQQGEVGAQGRRETAQEEQGELKRA